MKYVLFPCLGVVLRPGFIYGIRNVGSVKLPLGVIGSLLEMVSSCATLHPKQHLNDVHPILKLLADSG
jgi:hypothetical protein